MEWPISFKMTQTWTGTTNVVELWAIFYDAVIYKLCSEAKFFLDILYSLCSSNATMLCVIHNRYLHTHLCIFLNDFLLLLLICLSSILLVRDRRYQEYMASMTEWLMNVKRLVFGNHLRVPGFSKSWVKFNFLIWVSLVVKNFGYHVAWLLQGK
jgi:hypothetical protein